MALIEWSWVALARVRARVEPGAGSLSWRWSGQSTVEYALVGALVVIAAAGALTLLGGELTSVFSRISNTLSGAAAASP
jgi:Flp pilus assembly pilin Flp